MEDLHLKIANVKPGPFLRPKSIPICPQNCKTSRVTIPLKGQETILVNLFGTVWFFFISRTPIILVCFTHGKNKIWQGFLYLQRLFLSVKTGGGGWGVGGTGGRGGPLVVRRYHSWLMFSHNLFPSLSIERVPGPSPPRPIHLHTALTALQCPGSVSGPCTASNIFLDSENRAVDHWKKKILKDTLHISIYAVSRSRRRQLVQYV